MKLVVLQEKLHSILPFVTKGVSTKTQLPILSNVLLATDQGRLRITATNLETSLSVWIGASIEEEGAITVPARFFQELISSFTKEKIELKSDETKLELVCGESSASLSGIPASEYPQPPELKRDEKISLDTGILEKGLTFVSIAASTDESRPLLTGINLLPKKGKLLMVATDGYRLSIKEIPEEPRLTKNVVVSARALGEVFRLATSESAARVEMCFSRSANQIAFLLENAEVTTRLIDGDYPPFERIIPAGFTTQVVFDRTELLRAVKFAAVYAKESANIIKFTVSDGGAVVSANTPQVGENKTSLTVKTEGEGGEIAFNARFLLDLLSVFPEESVVFEMTGPLAPGAFKSLNDPSYLHIIMPVRVQG